MLTFKLVVNGNILPDYELDQVKTRIAELFKLQDKPQQLAALFAGQAVTVKRGLSEQQAQAYLDAIRGAGLSCERIPEEPPEPTMPPLSTTEEPAATSAAPADIHTVDQTTPVVDANEPVFAGDQRAESSTTDSAWTDNPYQQPEAELNISQEASSLVLVPPRKLSGGAGLAWIKEGYGYFKLNPWTWIGMILLGMVVMMATAVIGGVIAAVFAPLAVLLLIGVYLFTPVFAASFILACYELHQGEKFGVGALFSGFKNNLSGLMGLGVIYTVLYAIVMAIAMGGMMLMGSQDNLMMGQGSPMALVLYNLIVMGLSIPIVMAIWFAPALVSIHGVPPLKAMGMSLKGCLRNVWPFTIYGLVSIVLAILASIPLGLGWLVLMPVMTGSIFAGYRQIFTEESDVAPVSATLSE